MDPCTLEFESLDVDSLKVDDLRKLCAQHNLPVTSQVAMKRALLQLMRSSERKREGVCLGRPLALQAADTYVVDNVKFLVCNQQASFKATPGVEVDTLKALAESVLLGGMLQNVVLQQNTLTFEFFSPRLQLRISKGKTTKTESTSSVTVWGSKAVSHVHAAYEWLKITLCDFGSFNLSEVVIHNSLLSCSTQRCIDLERSVKTIRAASGCTVDFEPELFHAVVVHTDDLVFRLYHTGKVNVHMIKAVTLENLRDAWRRLIPLVTFAPHPGKENTLTTSSSPSKATVNSPVSPHLSSCSPHLSSCSPQPCCTSPLQNKVNGRRPLLIAETTDFILDMLFPEEDGQSKRQCVRD
jgi:TATA-box binding protein (TBP) (component of TFIID and TFIIIB)